MLGLLVVAACDGQGPPGSPPEGEGATGQPRANTPAKADGEAAGSPPSTPGDGAPGSTPGRARAEPRPVVGDPGALAPLAGEYAARVVYQQLQTLDVGLGIGGTLLNTTTALDRVTLEPDGSYIEQPCDVQIDSQDGDGSSGLFVAQVTLNPALFPRLPPLLRRMEFDGERWELPFASQAIGWRAEQDVDAEPLPEADDDPRLVDDDGDGKPGVTTTLSGNAFASGDLYVVQRKNNRLVGRLEGDILVGEVFDRGEQRVLGGTAPAAEQSLAPAGDASTNRVVLVPVEPTLSCEQLLEQADALFPPHPVFGS